VAIGRTTRRLGLRSWDRDDFVQDVWLFLLSRAPVMASQFQGRSSYPTYLSRVVDNYGSNWRRAHMRRTRRFPLMADCPGTSLGHTEGQIAAVLERHRDYNDIDRELLRTTLSLLRPNERWLLREWMNGGPAAPAASAHGLSKNAVYCRISRLLRKVRRHMPAIAGGDRVKTGQRRRAG
jgi:DNA-directed RNA polymerase specialized sigma24 family protein